MSENWKDERDRHAVGDELTEEEQEGVRFLLASGVSDEEICRGADQGDPASDHIFHSWSRERRVAAARLVDEKDGL